jgi:PrcB C-terminal
MNIGKDKKRPTRRRFYLPLALTLATYSILPLTLSESSAARTPRASNNVELVKISGGQNTYFQPGGIKVLAEGYHSKITKPFVAVVRDEETYAALTRLDENLPKLDSDFFKEKAVLAAFLGERNTGGYSVEITPSPIDINVLEKKPGKGVMVPQMITSPFKVVALEGGSSEAVRLMLDDAWRNQMQPFDVQSGTFSMSGGFVGTSEGFQLKGVIGVMREGKLATFWFHVVGSGGKKRRLLMECATGLRDDEKGIQINRMSADSLVDPPNSGLAARATFSEEGRKLTLSLLSRTGLIADGYSGGGTIVAVLRAAGFKPETSF